MDTQTAKLTAVGELTNGDAQTSSSEEKLPIKVAAFSEMPLAGTSKEFCAGGKVLCIANVDGEICATDNSCPHLGGPLGRGRIRDGKIICPWHGWPFDPKTGETPRRPTARASIYKVSIEGEDVFVSPE